MKTDQLCVAASGPEVDGDLRATLAKLLHAGTDTNPALNALIHDYALFHAVLALVGGVFLLACLLLSYFFWARLARTRRERVSASRFERWTYASFGLLSVTLALFLAVVVAANLSTVANPRVGLSGSLPLLGTPSAGSSTAVLQDSVASWVASGKTSAPAVVRDRVADRLEWQRPKAIVVTLLLFPVVLITAGIWRTLIRRSRDPGQGARTATASLLVTGVVSVAASLLLMLMVMGNTQGAIAPLSLTLFLG